MTNPVGRPPGRGKVPGSGRKKGSLDRSARMLISEQLAFDVLKTYKKLGPDWLLKVAQERPDLFINQCLSKLLPPAFKEDMGDGNTFNTQINYGDERGAALRVAFMLNKAMHDNGLAAPVAERVVPEMTPQQACHVPDDNWQPSPHLGEAVMDPDRERWVAELPLTPEERRNAALVRETQEVNINNYRGGSPAEQGGYYQPPEVQTKASARELCRRLSRRGRDLL